MTPLEEMAAAVERYRLAGNRYDLTRLPADSLATYRAQADLERIAGSALMAMAVVDLSAKLDAVIQTLNDVVVETGSHMSNRNRHCGDSDE